jgi:hypothetical protein
MKNIALPALSSVAPRFSKFNYMTFIRKVEALPEVKANFRFLDFLSVAWIGANSVGIKKADIKHWLEEMESDVHDDENLPANYRELVAFQREFYRAALK